MSTVWGLIVGFIRVFDNLNAVILHISFLDRPQCLPTDRIFVNWISYEIQVSIRLVGDEEAFWGLPSADVGTNQPDATRRASRKKAANGIVIYS